MRNRTLAMVVVPFVLVVQALAVARWYASQQPEPAPVAGRLEFVGPALEEPRNITIKDNIVVAWPVTIPDAWPDETGVCFGDSGSPDTFCVDLGAIRKAAAEIAAKSK